MVLEIAFSVALMVETVEDYYTERRGKKEVDEETHRVALRTAFVSRFIVLREGRRSRAHRMIESMSWAPEMTAEELADQFRQAFIDNGDKLQPVERDIRRALEHAHCSVDHFIDQYLGRATFSFREALEDYERSNRLLFGDDPEDVPRSGGWRLAEQMADSK